MSLFLLPPEILIQIFDYVGSSYFRSDSSRLTVCKQWSKFAQTLCFRDFCIVQKTLRRLLSSPYRNSSLPLIKNNIETLTLELKGFEDWDSIPLSDHDSHIENVLNESILDGAHGRTVRAAWTTELNNDLLYFATVIKQSRKLSILRIRATSELHPLVPLLERRDYLSLSTIRAILSVSSLTSLELDLCGTRLISNQSEKHGEGFHICPSVAAHLTTLQRLRLRMRFICADVLKPQQPYTSLRLTEILINLSLSDESPWITSAAHATSCSSPTSGLLQLKMDLEKQAQVLVAHMAAPKVVRVLTHTLPNVRLRAFDVLSSKAIVLSGGAEWDDEGEAIEDTVSEESAFSDFSIDDDS